MTQIIYELTLDETNTRVLEMKVTTLCATKKDNKPVPKKIAFSSAEHIAFVATYTFTDQNKVEKFRVPSQAVRLLK